jgi:protein tyrosine phosphatase
MATNMTSFLRLPDFIRSSNTIKSILEIGEQSPEILAKSKQVYVELPSVFAHLIILLIETLSETQHGQLTISSKKGKYEAIVELSGHISHRYTLNQQQLLEIQKLHDYIIDTWIDCRHSHNQK